MLIYGTIVVHQKPEYRPIFPYKETEKTTDLTLKRKKKQRSYNKRKQLFLIHETDIRFWISWQNPKYEHGEYGYVEECLSK